MRDLRWLSVPVQAKADAEVVCVRPALEHPNVTLLPNAEVIRLETSASGREVTGVVVRRGEATERYFADMILWPQTGSRASPLQTTWCRCDHE
jgi:choline dehydrogenase-like flavoprotein